MVSQTMQGLLDHVVDQGAARTVFYGCQVASGLVRLDMLRERWLAESRQPAPESVTETTLVDLEQLAPDEEYRGPSGIFEPQWSMAKYLYEQECERVGRPKPTSAADFPASGWLTEEEITEDPDEFNDRYRAQIDELGKQAAAARGETYQQHSEEEQNATPATQAKAVKTAIEKSSRGNDRENSKRNGR